MWLENVMRSWIFTTASRSALHFAHRSVSCHASAPASRLVSPSSFSLALRSAFRLSLRSVSLLRPRAVPLLLPATLLLPFCISHLIPSQTPYGDSYFVLQPLTASHLPYYPLRSASSLVWVLLTDASLTSFCLPSCIPFCVKSLTCSYRPFQTSFYVSHFVLLLNLNNNWMTLWWAASHVVLKWNWICMEMSGFTAHLQNIWSANHSIDNRESVDCSRY